MNSDMRLHNLQLDLPEKVTNWMIANMFAFVAPFVTYIRILPFLGVSKQKRNV